MATREEYDEYVRTWEPDPEFAPLSRAYDSQSPLTWEEFQLSHAHFEAHVAQLREKIEAKSTEWLRQFGVPEDKVEQLANELDETLALKAVATDHWVTVLSGGTGSGKTMAAAAWLRERVREDARRRNLPKGWTERWWYDQREHVELFYGSNQPLFITSARLSRWDKWDEKAMNKLLKAPYLVVDDLGVEYADKNGFFLGILDEVVDARYGAKRPTLYTTNLAVGDFKARYGERFADRIREAGRFVNVTIPSMRKKDAA